MTWSKDSNSGEYIDNLNKNVIKISPDINIVPHEI